MKETREHTVKVRGFCLAVRDMLRFFIFRFDREAVTFLKCDLHLLKEL